jgi:predicted flavoprotein YhiN
LVLRASHWLKQQEGRIIKNITLTCKDETVSGDLVVTKYGLEGKPAYAVNRMLRENQLHGLTMDMKPQYSRQKIEETLKQQHSVRKAWAKLRLPVSIYDWLRENLTKEQFTDPEILAEQIKTFPIEVLGLRPIDEVISTVGGVSMEALTERGQLKGYDRVFCCGEMLDWDAPTGGYLIQGCVASGYVVGKAIALIDAR